MIAFLAFLGRKIIEEETLKSPRVQLVSSLLRDVNKGYTTKNSKRKGVMQADVRKIRRKTLERTMMTKDFRWHSIN